MVTINKLAVISIINGIGTDVRVLKTCNVLMELGYSIIVIDRNLATNLTLNNSKIKVISMSFIVNKGILFYLAFQIKLFFKLLFLKPTILVSNDLDTLAPNYLISRIKNIPLIYDSHELFTEVPELKNSKIKKKIWEKLEAFLIPKLSILITVNESIAQLFFKKYNKRFNVVRNIPDFITPTSYKSKKELGLPEDKHIVLLQGSGINIDRGAEELIQSFNYLDDNYLLLIIGSGDVWNELIELAKKLNLSKKIVFINKLPKSELINYTVNATIGVSIDKPTNLNYYNSLPNKIFDYAFAKLPMLVSNLPEISAIVNKYNVGKIIATHEPIIIANAIKEMTTSSNYTSWKQNCSILTNEINWKNESKILKKIIEDLAN